MLGTPVVIYNNIHFKFNAKKKEKKRSKNPKGVGATGLTSHARHRPSVASLETRKDVCGEASKGDNDNDDNDGKTKPLVLMIKMKMMNCGGDDCDYDVL